MKRLNNKIKEMNQLFDSSKSYNIQDAIALLRKFEPLRKFKQAVELYVTLKEAKKKKGNVVSRFVFNITHGLPQDLKILAVVNSTMEKQLKEENKFKNLHISGEEAIEKIVRDGKTEYNMIVCTTDMFSKFAKHAKILGQMRLMPSAKAGTVLDNIMAGVKDLLLGTKIKVKKDINVLRMKMANADFENQQIEDNFHNIINGVKEEIKEDIKSIHIKLSMSPSVRVSLGNTNTSN